MKLKLSVYSTCSFLLLLLLMSSCFLQSKNRRAQRQLQKDKFFKSEQILRKALAKDSLNPAAYWLLSQLYLDTTYQQNIDTAHLFILKAQQQAPLERDKDKKRWRKLGLDSTALALQHSLVDSAAFARASQQHTVASYQYFLNLYADAQQTAEATEQRNMLAFAAAEEVGTWQAYQQFFQTYPQARQIPEARERYEELLFKERTRTGTLQAYRRFLAEHPQTPYRDRLLRNIYRLSTADHQAYSYYQYIRRYPESPYSQQALLQLYYLHDQPGSLWQTYSELPKPDSLSQLARLAHQQVIAVLKEGKWAFISEDGSTVFAPQFDDVHPTYVCESLESDYAEVFAGGQAHLISWNGKILFRGDYEAADPLGNALLRIQEGGRWGLMLKGGQWLLQPDYSNIRMLGPDLLLVQQDRLQGLLAPNGLWLINPQADSLARLQDFILRVRAQQISVHSRENLIRAAQENERQTPSFSYQSVKLLGDSLLLAIRPDSSWQVLRSDLSSLASGHKQQPQAIPGALVVQHREGYQILNKQGQEALPGRYQQLTPKGNTIAVKQAGRWSLWRLPHLQSLAGSYDSLQVLHPQLVWFRNSGRDSLLFLAKQQRIPLQQNESLRLLRPQYVPDSLMARFDRYEKVVISSGKNLKVYNLQGKLLLQGRYEEVQAPDTYLLILKNDRGIVTLVDTTGQPITKTAYDGIGNYQQGYLAILKGNRFGTLNPYLQVQVNPQFDAAPRPYNQQLLMATKSRKWGLIDTKGKAIVPHRFESIRYWTDSLALVQADDAWQLLHIYNQQALLSDILELQWLRDPGHAKGGMAIFETDAGYGIVSAREGVLALPVYYDIQNLGTSNAPLFYLERRDKASGTYEIIYMNEKGKQLFKNTYTKADWEMLLCD